MYFARKTEKEILSVPEEKHLRGDETGLGGFFFKPSRDRFDYTLNSVGDDVETIRSTAIVGILYVRKQAH
jgi:hypothetical protein